MNYYPWVNDKLDNHDSGLWKIKTEHFFHKWMLNTAITSLGGGWRYTKIQGTVLIILEMAKNSAVALLPNKPWKKNAQVHIWFSCLFLSKTTLSNSTMHSLIHTLTHTHTVAICHTLTFPSSPRLTVLPGHMLTNDSITLLPPHYGG